MHSYRALFYLRGHVRIDGGAAYARDRVIGPSIPTDHGFTCTRTRGSPATSPEGAPEDGAIIRKSSRHRITGPCPLSRHNPTRRFHPYTGACGAKKRISIGSGNLRKYSLACNRRVSQEKSAEGTGEREGGRKEYDRSGALDTPNSQKENYSVD